jgi:hypothetical protein
MTDQTERLPLNRVAATEKERLLLAALATLDKLGVSPLEVHAYNLMRAEYAAGVPSEEILPVREDFYVWGERDIASGLGRDVADYCVALGDEITPDGWNAQED